MSVQVFLVGTGGIGRKALEVLVDMERFSSGVSLEAVFEDDFERKERAESFVDACNVEAEFFESLDDFYSRAGEVDGDVLVYGAGEFQDHGDLIRRSLRHGFYHLAERPPSTSREEHRSERKLAEEGKVDYKVDFIERQHPIVKKAGEVLKDESVEGIQVFRESSVGVQKLIQPVELSGVKGGCVLDKMINDVYALDFMDVNELNLDDLDVEYFMPYRESSEKFLGTSNEKLGGLNENAALGSIRAEFTANGKEAVFRSSWLGVSERTRVWNRKVKENFDRKLIDEKYTEVDGRGLRNEESRFFVINGSKRLLGDLLNGKLYDMDAGDELEVDEMVRGQLYRVIEKAVKEFGDERSHERELAFVEGLFDVQEAAFEEAGEEFDELDKASERINQLMVSSKEEFEKNELKGVAS